MHNIIGISLLDSTEQHQNIVTGHSYIKHEVHNIDGLYMLKH